MTARVVGRKRAFSGLRPLDPSRDLGQVADLIEEAFGEGLSREGREALRDLRVMSYFGPLLWLLDRISPEFHEALRGFVWVEEGRVVGNVNVNQAFPHYWLISNVAVRPAWRRRGIARQLVRAALEEVRRQGGGAVALQVRADNLPALRLYQSFGFQQIAAVTELRLKGTAFRPPTAEAPIAEGFTLRPRRYDEWRKEYELALAATPAQAWRIKPAREEDFRVGIEERISKALGGLLTGRREHRLAVEKAGRFIATLTVRATRWLGEHRLEMMVHPDYCGRLEEMLVAKALAILAGYPRRAVLVSHPAEHGEAIEALKRHGFVEEGTLVYMWLELRGWPFVAA